MKCPIYSHLTNQLINQSTISEFRHKNVIETESWGKQSQYPEGFGPDKRLSTIFYSKLLVNVVQVSFDSLG